MLYLRRSQINVPRDRHLGNSSHLNVADEWVFEILNLKRGILTTLKPAKEVLTRGRALVVAFSVSIPGAQRSSAVLTPGE